jgi:hypothetical protein
VVPAQHKFGARLPNVAGLVRRRGDLTGEALRARIEANLARQSQPELSAIHLVRQRSDLTDAMPRFVTAYLEAQLPA